MMKMSTESLTFSPALSIKSLGRHDEKPVTIWLYSCCVMVFIMVMIGGLTRLTDSGLSMVEWRPLLGILPPLSDTEWSRLFALYQETPEYQAINAGMTLLEFKAIFWLEYIHRLWGRIIGLVFILPMVIFWAKGMVRPRQKGHLLIVLVLGSTQAVLGWYMVQSGLIDRPDVSHYRLSAHLSLALIIYAYLFFLARSGSASADGNHHLGYDDPKPNKASRIWIISILILIGITIIYGGLVAGLDAGLAYNQFPLMGESVLPPDALIMNPWFLNLSENIGMVQFIHRWLAITTVLACLAFWVSQRRQPQIPKTATMILAVVALIQAGLGITTLIFYVPLPLALIHQAGAVILLTTALWITSAVFTQSNRIINGS